MSTAFARNHRGPSHAGPGPSQPPRKSSAPRKLVPSMWAYSPSWISANFIPLYSTRKPATSSDSASRMSNGTRFDILRSEEHTSELQSHHDLVCRLLLEKKKKINTAI